MSALELDLLASEHELARARAAYSAARARYDALLAAQEARAALLTGSMYSGHNGACAAAGGAR